LSSHFKQDRPINDEDGNSPDHWFTGPDVGFFGGVSYQTPWDPVKLNLDWSADRYEIEKGLVSDYNAPSPWSFGATIQVRDNLSFHGAVVGKEKIMGRFVFSNNADEIETKKHIESTPYKIRKGDKSDFSRQYMGLSGKRYFLPERLIYASSGTTSPAEMWHALETESVKTAPYFRTHHWFKPHKTRLRLEHKFSLSDEDNFSLFRNSAILENVTETGGSFFTSLGLRVNAGDNLRGIVIPSTTKTVRRDEADFAETPITIDHATLFKNHSFGDLHTHISAGYLEEMYAGYGGEVLYRPYGHTYAIGVEGWNTYRRDFDSTLNAEIITDNDGWTGFVNAYYEIPNSSTTIHGKVGRYLGQDFGGTASVSHSFKNGVVATGYLTLTDEDDIDVFGGADNVFGGLRLSIPTKPDRFKKICCDVDVRIEPLGRDTGQALNKSSLYETSDPLSYRHVMQNWEEIRDASY
ncbi:MAG: YjbH domain-containing protein, partial [Bdellovibrionales bacterium]